VQQRLTKFLQTLFGNKKEKDEGFADCSFFVFFNGDC